VTSARRPDVRRVTVDSGRWRRGSRRPGPAAETCPHVAVGPHSRARPLDDFNGTVTVTAGRRSAR
jgi:hypothetical protein